MSSPPGRTSPSSRPSRARWTSSAPPPPTRSRGILDRAGVEFIGGTAAIEVTDGALLTEDGSMHAADAVIALPRLRGPYLDGLPADADGFIAIDAYARVVGVRDVFAAGDATDQPIKQGGLATQQADAAAEMIAAEAGRRRACRGRSGASCAASCSPARRRSSCAATSMTTRRSCAHCAGPHRACPAPGCGGRPGRSPAAT